MRKGIILSICIFFLGCEFEKPDTSGLEPDPTYPWDTDGDWISNNTENNSANADHGFNPDVADENPSIAKGTPTNETLTNIWGDGTGYYQWHGGDALDSDDWGTLALLNTIEWAGRMLTGDQPTPYPWTTNENTNFTGIFGALDLSLQNGGDWAPDHESHQNGLDVDIRYVRVDRAESGFNFDEDPIEDYDYWATLKLFEAVYMGSNNTIDFFIVDDRAGSLEPANEAWEVITLPNHHHHFHVRIKDPDGTDN